MISATYVRTNNGTWLIQVPDPGSRWGFFLAADDQTWDGGIGCGARSWITVEIGDVPDGVRSRLDWVLAAAES